MYGNLNIKKGGEPNFSKGGQRPLPLQMVFKFRIDEPDLQRVMDIG
jgi:hypothetical protein